MRRAMRSDKTGILGLIFVYLLVPVLIVLVSPIIKVLWNWLMTELFGYL